MSSPSGITVSWLWNAPKNPFRGYLLSCQHVAADVAQVFACRYVACEYVSQQCAYLKFAVSGFQHFGTCHGYCTGEIHMSRIEKTADEDDGLRINCPYCLAFGYRGKVVDLNTYVTCRVRSVKCGDCDVLCLSQCGSVLLHAYVQVCFAILARASSPVWKFASSPFNANWKSGASGLLSKADTKMPFGVTVGSAMMS